MYCVIYVAQSVDTAKYGVTECWRDGWRLVDGGIGSFQVMLRLNEDNYVDWRSKDYDEGNTDHMDSIVRTINGDHSIGGKLNVHLGVSSSHCLLEFDFDTDQPINTIRTATTPQSLPQRAQQLPMTAQPVLRSIHCVHNEYVCFEA